MTKRISWPYSGPALKELLPDSKFPLQLKGYFWDKDTEGCIVGDRESPGGWRAMVPKWWPRRAVFPNSVKVFAWIMPLFLQVHEAGIPAPGLVNNIFNKILNSKLAKEGMASNVGPVHGRRVRQLLTGFKQERPGMLLCFAQLFLLVLTASQYGGGRMIRTSLCSFPSRPVVVVVGL